MKKIGLLNGPNLDRLGKREPEVYGTATLSDIEKQAKLKAVSCNCEIEAFQSNHEGALIDKIHEWADAGFAGLILNPGGLTHTSVALRDAVVASGLTTVEVHLSNIWEHISSKVCSREKAACVSHKLLKSFAWWEESLHIWQLPLPLGRQDISRAASDGQRALESSIPPCSCVQRVY